MHAIYGLLSYTSHTHTHTYTHTHSHMQNGKTHGIHITHVVFYVHAMHTQIAETCIVHTQHTHTCHAHIMHT